MPGGRVPWIWVEGEVSRLRRCLFVVRGGVGGCYLD